MVSLGFPTQNPTQSPISALNSIQGRCIIANITVSQIQKHTKIFAEAIFRIVSETTNYRQEYFNRNPVEIIEVIISKVFVRNFYPTHVFRSTR